MALGITAAIFPFRLHPALPAFARRSPAFRPPDWAHEIKHDGYRLMARRYPVGVRLLTRNGQTGVRARFLGLRFNLLQDRSIFALGIVVCPTYGFSPQTTLNAPGKLSGLPVRTLRQPGRA